MHTESRLLSSNIERWFEEAPKELLTGCWDVKVIGKAPVVKDSCTTTTTEPVGCEYLEPMELQTLTEKFEGE